MENTHIAKLVLSFQRQTFDAVCHSAELLRDYSEKSVNTLVGQNKWIPEEGRNLYSQWGSVCRQGYDTVKKTVQAGFDHWQEYLEGAERKN